MSNAPWVLVARVTRSVRGVWETLMTPRVTLARLSAPVMLSCRAGSTGHLVVLGLTVASTGPRVLVRLAQQGYLVKLGALRILGHKEVTLRPHAQVRRAEQGDLVSEKAQWT